MNLLSNERRYATWTVTSKSTLSSAPSVAYRKFGDQDWTWLVTTWVAPEYINADGNHVRACTTLFCGPDAQGAGAAVLDPGKYETQIRYTDSVEIIAAETDEIHVEAI